MNVFGIHVGRKYYPVPYEGRKTSLAWKVTRLLYLGNEAVFMPKNYAAFAKQGYQSCVDLYACVDWIARAVSGIPLCLYELPQRQGDKRKEINSHPVLDLLQRPNPDQGGSRLIDEYIRYYLIGGNAYMEKVMVGGVPRELYVLRPDRTEVLISDFNKRKIGHRYSAAGGKQDFLNGEVLHLKMFHPTNDFYGLSPIEIAAMNVDMANAAAKANTKLLQNDLRPAGVFMFKREMDKQSRDEFKKDIRENYGDAEQRGLPIVVDGDADYKELSQTAKDADFLEMDKLNTRKICRAYGLPPELIGDSENKTYANYQEGRLAGYMEVALPIAFFLRDELNNWLLRDFEDKVAPGEIGSKPRLALDWDLDKVEALQYKRLEAFSRMASAWWTSVSEKREATGYGKPQPGEVFFIPLGSTPITTEELLEPDQQEEPANEPESDPGNDAGQEGTGDEGKAAKIAQKARAEARKALKGYWTIGERKRALWGSYEQRITKREKSFESIAKRFLVDEAEAVAAKIRAYGSLLDVNPKAVLDIDHEASRYSKEFMLWYEDAFIRGGNAGINATKGILFDDGERKAEDPTSWTFSMTKQQRAKLKKMVLESGSEIGTTTLNKIFKELLSAQAQNLTIDEFAQQMYDKIKDMTYWRARLWSRTESSKTDNFGQLEGYRQSGFVDRKGWMSAFAENSREAHMAADNGSTIQLDADFDIGGQPMAFPGDPRGGAENCCNCMCSIYPEVSE